MHATLSSFPPLRICKISSPLLFKVCSPTLLSSPYAASSHHVQHTSPHLYSAKATTSPPNTATPPETKFTTAAPLDVAAGVALLELETTSLPLLLVDEGASVTVARSVLLVPFAPPSGTGVTRPANVLVVLPAAPVLLLEEEEEEEVYAGPCATCTVFVVGGATPDEEEEEVDGEPEEALMAKGFEYSICEASESSMMVQP